MHYSLTDKIDTDKLATGDTVDVLIEGKIYKTIIDENGTQRFPSNSVYEYMLEHDAKGNLIDHLNPRQMHTQMLNLNTLHIAFINGKFDKREYCEFRMTGYSVSGFCELSEFSDWHIQNPVWGDTEPQRIWDEEYENVFNKIVNDFAK